MSHAKNLPSNPTRRSVLIGTTAAAAVAGMAFGLPGSAAAAVKSKPLAKGTNPSELCLAHHKELSQHLRTVLNSAYVDENMKNKMLSTSHCPHCKVGLAPDMPNLDAIPILT